MSINQSINDYSGPNEYGTAEKIIIWLTGTTISLISWWVLLRLDFNLAVNIPLLANEKLAWYLTRASGTVGYLLVTASTMWGLLLSTKVIKEWVPAPVALAMHTYLSWTAIGLSLFHAFVLLFDGYYTYTVANLLIPFTGPYRPGWVGAGTIAFYIMLLTTLSFYCRQWIGQKAWRKLHYLTFGVFVLGTLHGWQAGTDSAQLEAIYVASTLAVIFLTIYRILTAISSKKSVRSKKQDQS